MRICIICKTPFGGFKSFLNNLVSILSKRGFEIDILNVGDKSYTVDGARLLDVSFNKSQKVLSIRDLVFLFFGFLETLYKKSCALFFVNNQVIQRKSALCSSEFFAAKEILKKRNFLDLTEYDCVLSSEEIYCNYFLSRRVLAKKKIGYIHPDYKMAGFDKRIDKYFLKKLDAICAVSLANAETLKREIPSLAQKVVGVPNPIDFRAVQKKANQPCDTVFDRDKINLITVCRLDNSSKALDRLVRIAARLKKNKVKFCWRVIGDGPYKEPMEKMIADGGLSDEVVLVGFRENPLPYIKASDLFVLQSYYEGYPISVCEALILNVPSLITDFPASKELIVDGVNGVIAKNEEEDIFYKIYNLLTKSDTLETMKETLNKSDKNHFARVDRLVEAMETYEDNKAY